MLFKAFSSSHHTGVAFADARCYQGSWQTNASRPGSRSRSERLESKQGICKAEPSPPHQAQTAVPGGESSSAGQTFSTGNSSSSGAIGRRAAFGAVGLGVAAFGVSRLSGGEVTLKTLEKGSLPLDTALQNHRPTMVEFYAGWCEICRELTPEVYKVKQQYKDKVNFVMLNIENPKWAPEMAEYRVRGIPHFVFLNANGQAEAAAVGRLPTEVLQRNLAALADGSKLSLRGASGETSSVSGRITQKDISPRSHS